MDRLVKVAIFPDNVTRFNNVLPKLIRRIPDLSLSQKYELLSHPKEFVFVENIFPILDTTPPDKSAILVALRNLYSLDPDKDYESYARNALPILKWIHEKKDLLINVMQIAFSTNPFIFRRQWSYTLISKSDDNMRAGIEAYQASYPLEHTIIQFIDGYDPTHYQFHEAIGNDFDVTADFIIQNSKSKVVVEQTIEISTKNEKKNTSLQLNRPGIKSDPLYNQAFEKIYGGMTAVKAFKEYLNAALITESDKKNRAAFKAAMRRRQKMASDLISQAIQKIRNGASQKEAFQEFCKEMGFDTSKNETIDKFTKTIRELDL